MSKIGKVSIILLFCILPLLMISACTPQEPETAATIVVQRPTFTPTLLQPTETASATQTPLPTATYIPTATRPRATSTLPPDSADEEELAFPHWTGPTYTPTPSPTTPFGLAGWPPECTPPTQLSVDWLPCQVEPLPDKRWIILRYGPEICGSGQRRRLINLLTQETQDLEMGNIFAVLPNGKVIFSFAYCSAGHLSLFDPDIGEMTRLGWSGRTIWNKRHTAFIEQVIHVSGVGPIWGYNLETDHSFLPEVESQISNQPIWTPDDNHVIYNQTTFTYTEYISITASPTEISVIDAYSGEKRVLASDPQFHYFLCPESCEWDGDWIEVRQIPYQIEEYSLDPSEYDPRLNCLLDGRGCGGEVTVWQLNWRTGELRPHE